MKEAITVAEVIFTFAFLFSTISCFAFLFLRAYFSGDYTESFNINRYGEANIELIFLIAGMITTSHLGIKLIKRNI